MSPFPPAEGLDQTMALWKKGYLFIHNRCERYSSDAFLARLMLRRVVCMRGPSAAELVYAGDRFIRVGAMPVTVLKLLQDFGSVNLMHGEAHRVRKRMFMRLAGSTQVRELAAIAKAEWHSCFERQVPGPIDLFDIVREIFTRATLRWAEALFSEASLAKRIREFSELDRKYRFGGAEELARATIADPL